MFSFIKWELIDWFIWLDDVNKIIWLFSHLQLIKVIFEFLWKPMPSLISLVFPTNIIFLPWYCSFCLSESVLVLLQSTLCSIECILRYCRLSWWVRAYLNTHTHVTMKRWQTFFPSIMGKKKITVKRVTSFSWGWNLHWLARAKMLISSQLHTRWGPKMFISNQLTTSWGQKMLISNQLCTSWGQKMLTSNQLCIR